MYESAALLNLAHCYSDAVSQDSIDTLIGLTFSQLFGRDRRVQRAVQSLPRGQELGQVLASVSKQLLRRGAFLGYRWPT